MHYNSTKRAPRPEQKATVIHQASTKFFKALSLVTLGVSITLGVQAFTNGLPDMHGSAAAFGISVSLWLIASRFERRTQ